MPFPRYTCDVNVTQYGTDSLEDDVNYTKEKRRNSVTFSIELEADLDAQQVPVIPSSYAAARKFNQENS